LSVGPIGSEKSSDGSCSACAAGRHGVLLPTIGKTVCVACMSGRFQPNTGQTSCSTCAAGSHQLATGQTKCQTRRMYSVNWVSSHCSLANKDFAKVLKSCGKNGLTTVLHRVSDMMRSCMSLVACPGGKYQPFEGKQCISCGAGQFQADAGKQSCELCDTAITSGQVECPAEDTRGDLHLSDISCRPGKFVKELGKASLCVVCQAGTFQQFSNKRYCQGKQTYVCTVFVVKRPQTLAGFGLLRFSQSVLLGSTKVTKARPRAPRAMKVRMF
jgi:hypothetical protein